jgi:bifunctional pyridoxal-dependent enzyme with beta-cystathionase and maltose regulon repressor activities
MGHNHCIPLRIVVREGTERFEMDLDGLEDDMTFRKRGSYFVTSEQNRLGSTWE